ncbi:MAG: hypothetical protein ACHQ6V_00465 [Myxococcota bacterium]
MPELAADRERAAAYAPFVLAAAPRLLADLDREPHSVSYGSFDRDHWGWKFRDFPILMTQWAVLPAALLARMDLPGSPYFGSAALLGWAGAALRVLCERQHASGAWDSIGPNNQDYGGALGSAYYLVETARALHDALDDADRARIGGCLERAVRFARRSREDHAFVSNHQALYALGWHAAGEWLGDATLAKRADETIDAILARQHADGFYCEYGGFDPGYETLGIQYLARYWEKTRDARVLASLRRAVAFLAHAVHPDGSVGGAYGSRHTRLYFPAGFEILASEIPEAAGIAAFMRARLARGEVVTPANVDAHNAYVVNLSYLHACAVTSAPAAPAPLPCEALREQRLFSSGLLVAGTDAYYAVFAMNKAGIGRVHGRATGELAHQDAGWVLRDENGMHATQLARAEFARLASGEYEARGALGVVQQEQLTPLRFLVLRALNLTLFRSEALGRWIRRLVIERLITRVPASPHRFTRRVRFGAEEIELSDVLESPPDAAVSSAELARNFTAIHMGSAKYFHASALAELAQAGKTLPALAGRRSKLTTLRLR